MALLLSDLLKNTSSANTNSTTTQDLISSIPVSSPKATFLDKIGLALSSLSPLDEAYAKSQGKDVGLGDYISNIGKGLIAPFNSKLTKADVNRMSSSDAADKIAGDMGLTGLGKTAASIGIDIFTDPGNFISLGTGGAAKGAAGLTDDVAKVVGSHIDEVSKIAGVASELTPLQKVEAFASSIGKTKGLKKTLQSTLKSAKALNIPQAEIGLEAISRGLTEDIIRDVSKYGSKTKWFDAIPGLKNSFDDILKATEYSGKEVEKVLKGTKGLNFEIPFTKVKKQIASFEKPLTSAQEIISKVVPPQITNFANETKKIWDGIFKAPLERINNPYLKTERRKLEGLLKGINSQREVVQGATQRIGTDILKQGFSEQDIIGAIEYLGMPDKQGTIAKIMPNVPELVKNPAFQDLYNYYQVLMKDTPGSIKRLGVDPLDGGYIFRSMKGPSSNIIQGIEKAAPKAKDLLKGSINARKFDTFAEALEYANKNGLEMVTDIPYLIGESFQRGRNAIAADSFYTKMLGTNWVKEGKDIALKEKDKWGKVNLPIFKDKVVKKEIADVINESNKIFQSNEATGKLLNLYDKVQNIWKRTVTIYFPSFSVRNGMNNVYVNFLAGVKGYKPYSYADEVFQYANKLKNGEDVAKFGSKQIGKYTVKDMYDLAIKNGVLSGGQVLKDTLKADDIFRSIQKENPFKMYENLMTGANDRIENVSRLALFIDQLKKGYNPTDAAITVKKFLFNYDELSSTESEIFKRIIPFYTFMRNNIALHTDLLLNSPQTLNKVLKGAQALKGESQQDLPEWTQEYMGVDLTKVPGINQLLGTSGGDTAIFTPGFGLSTEAMNAYFGSTPTELLNNLLQSTSPLIKTPIELATGQNLFKGKPIEEDTNGNTYANAPEFLKELVGYKETVKKDPKTGAETIIRTVDPYKKYWLNTVAGRFISTGRQFGDVGEAYSNGELSLRQLLPLISGIKIYEFNLPEERARREKEAQDRTIKELQKTGLVKSYTSTYIPKENTEEVRAIIEKYTLEK